MTLSVLEVAAAALELSCALFDFVALATLLQSDQIDLRQSNKSKFRREPCGSRLVWSTRCVKRGICTMQ